MRKFFKAVSKELEYAEIDAKEAEKEARHKNENGRR